MHENSPIGWFSMERNHSNGVLQENEEVDEQEKEDKKEIAENEELHEEAETLGVARGEIRVKISFLFWLGVKMCICWG